VGFVQILEDTQIVVSQWKCKLKGEGTKDNKFLELEDFDMFY
jgi:hypothetical protein